MNKPATLGDHGSVVSWRPLKLTIKKWVSLTIVFIIFSHFFFCMNLHYLVRRHFVVSFTILFHFLFLFGCCLFDYAALWIPLKRKRALKGRSLQIDFGLFLYLIQKCLLKQITLRAKNLTVLVVLVHTSQKIQRLCQRSQWSQKSSLTRSK